MGASTAATLQEAVRLHGEAALSEAASRFREVLQSEPEQALALYHLAVISCQQGELSQGVDLVRRSLVSDPHQPRAHNLLGMVLARGGRQQEALGSFEAAINEQPGFAEAHGNRASALMELGRVEEAIDGFERAVALAPDSAGDLLNLGTAQHRAGRHDDALASYDRVLTLQPGFAPAHCNRANVLFHIGRHADALAGYDHALAIERRYPEALRGRGMTLIRLGRVEGALANFEEALALARSESGALRQLVQALVAEGAVPAALTLATRALTAAETSEHKALFVACVRNRKFKLDPGGVRDHLARALRDGWDRPTDLAVPAASLVKLNPAIRDACSRAVSAWPRRLVLDDLSGRLRAIGEDELLHALLQNGPVCDVELERCLTGLRSIFLEAAGEGPAAPAEDGLLRFCCMLARQCFINEYVFDATALELETVAQMRRSVVQAIASGQTIPVLWLIAVASYEPLHFLPGAQKLLQHSWSPSVATLVDQQVREPADEQHLRETIPRLTAVTDPVSLKVRQHYEDNPYPRWVKPGPAPQPLSLGQYFGSTYKSVPAARQAETVDILVAGCGTGQNLVDTAREFKAAQVLAIDLSSASVAFAKRQASALGLGNIEFAVADIAQLTTLKRSFDIIEATGVLHHMADPWQGWRNLVAMLREGGFMRVGLYSKLARADVNAARAFVAGRANPPTLEFIRRSRQDLLALADDEPARRVAAYLDFFTTSECRDMLFHVQEHQMTLLEIAAFLAEQRLQFVSFILDPAAMQGFRSRYPALADERDLSLWDAFENDNPTTFAGMYQFWVRKPGSEE
ncbi:MAG: tetratricopeptide repeat protein [Xanthobacteraceae bacterium]